jgi:hypothetical protein
VSAATLFTCVIASIGRHDNDESLSLEVVNPHSLEVVYSYRSPLHFCTLNNFCMFCDALPAGERNENPGNPTSRYSASRSWVFLVDSSWDEF